jgi:hypothetical protein
MDDLDDLMSAFAGVNMDDHEQLVETFARVLGADADAARFFLESSSWNLELAVCNFLDTVGSRSNLETQQLSGVEPVSTFRGDENVQQIGQQVFAPGQPIQLVWGFINTGPVAWPADAALVHTEGERLGGARGSYGVGGCAPGEEATVQLQLAAPSAAGSYASCWRLRHSGGYFGEPIWLMVNVAAGDGTAATQQQQQQPAEDPVAMYTQLVATTGIDLQQQQMLQAQLQQMTTADEQVALLKQLHQQYMMQQQQQQQQAQAHQALHGPSASMSAGAGQLGDEDMDL